MTRGYVGRLTGRGYPTPRPKGYRPTWKPRGAFRRQLLADIVAVLEEYGRKRLLPLTCRQVFYRCVGAYGYDKTGFVAGQVEDLTGLGRLSGIIPWEAVTDGRTMDRQAPGYDDVASFWTATLDDAASYRHSRDEGQPYAVEIWAEAAGMVPQLARVARDFGVNVYGWQGEATTTARRAAAERIRLAGRPFVALCVGDHDEHGGAILDSVAEDVAAFLGAAVDCVRFEWLAVTPAQVERYGLPEQPPKPKDKGGRKTPGTPLAYSVQVEALAPEDLAAEVLAALVAWTDDEQRQAVLAREAEERAQAVDEVRQAVVFLGYEWTDHDDA